MTHFSHRAIHCTPGLSLGFIFVYHTDCIVDISIFLQAILREILRILRPKFVILYKQDFFIFPERNSSEAIAKYCKRRYG